MNIFWEQRALNARRLDRVIPDNILLAFFDQDKRISVSVAVILSRLGLYVEIQAGLAAVKVTASVRLVKRLDRQDILPILLFEGFGCGS